MGFYYGGSLGLIVGALGARARVILVLSECIGNAPAVSLVLPHFDDTGSLCYPAGGVVYPRGFHRGLLPPVSLREIGRLS